MPHAQPLPTALPERFSVAEARRLGIPPSRLRAADLRAPFAGVRGPASAAAVTLLERCQDYAPRLAPGQFFSHETVFVLLELSTPEWPYEPRIHVSTHRPAREPRVRGVVGHRLQTRETAARLGPFGLPMEDPIRAWRQCGRLWPFDDLVAGADALLGPGSDRDTRSRLQQEVREMGDVRGGILAAALHLAREGVRSPRETHLRLLLARHRMPSVEVNADIFDARGGFVAEIDLAYPRWKVAVEYDGRVHAEDDRQFAKDADRWAAIRAAGWDHVRVLHHHLRDGGGAAVALVRNALVAAGWRPGL